MQRSLKKRMCARILAAILFIALCFGLAGCGPAEKTYDASDYILSVDYEEDFRILQLTDIHMANKDNRQLHYDFMDLTFADADADMVVLCGDNFTFADKRVAKEFFAYMDSKGIPWCITFGNHDEQCYFPINWMTDVLNNYGSNCVFKDIQDDEVYGNANYAVNLVDGDTTVAQVILLDSNRYNYGEYWGYDYLKESQIDWYERVVRYTTGQNNGTPVPSVAFFHIPVPEFEAAWAELTENGTETPESGAKTADSVYISGGRAEGVSCPKINTGFFDRVLELGSTKAICVGHDHVNDSKVLYKGVYLCYGVNSTNRIYYEDGLMGGQIVVVHRDGSLDFEEILHSYDELAGK